MELIVIGMGQFGSALARMYERQGLRVSTIANGAAPNPVPERELKNRIALLCVPTQSLPEALKQRGDLLRQAHGIITTAKGLIQTTGQTASQLLTKALPRKTIFVLSGPSFAAEIQKGQPTALVLAGKNKTALHSAIELLSTKQLRLYKSFDPLGVELCGALKNVYAIAAGVSAGLGFGDNTRAALNTRALAEMTRITRALGGHPMTVFGLAGVGDLFLTCSSHQSRNFQFGLGLAQGKSPKALLAALGTVEGVWTAAAAKKIAKKKGIRAPLIDAVTALLNGEATPTSTLEGLMTRKIRHEFE